MNKLGIVLGIAAVAVIAGCKDPNYQRKTPKGEASNIGTQVEQTPEPDTPVVVDEKHCTCPPGTKHTEPCLCGAPDCHCIVEQKIVEKKDVKPLPPPEPEYTVYIVQRGDYLAKISKKYNVTINSIKRLNNLKDDNIRIGQKLKIPAEKVVAVKKVEPKAAEPEVKAPVEAPVEPVAAPVEPTVEAPVAAPVEGTSAPTPTYTVQEGEDLTDISIRFGVTAAAVRELNNLGENDKLVAGQILKLPPEAQQQ